jgi:hypothetical protein
MKIPSPRETLAGCIWLPRILAKARLFKSGELPPEYAARFGHPGGVDGQFLNYFGLAREDMLAAADLPDDKVVAWFQSRYNTDRIVEWNRIAVNLGRPGFPMAERLPVALATTYKHVNPEGITTVFEVLEADERGGSMAD